MKRKEIAAAQKLELEQLAEREIADTRREGLQARERIDAAANGIAGRLGVDLPKADTVEPLLPIAVVSETALATTDAVSEDSSSPENDAKTPPREAANFADIAANIAGNDWKDL